MEPGRTGGILPDGSIPPRGCSRQMPSVLSFAGPVSFDAPVVHVSAGDKTFRPAHRLLIRPFNAFCTGTHHPPYPGVLVPQPFDDGIQLPAATIGVIPLGQQVAIRYEQGVSRPEAVDRCSRFCPFHERNPAHQGDSGRLRPSARPTNPAAQRGLKACKAEV